MSKKSSVIRVYNASSQTIPIQLRAPGSEFFTSEQQIRIRSGDSTLLPSSYIRSEQIKNLQAKGFLKVIYETEED